MDIRCERCATEYELDEAQVPDAGLPIKCSSCGHVFKVFKPAPPSATLRLMRNGQAMLLPCPDEATLEQWIKETRIIPTDEISFDGATWERLSDIPEVAGLFPPPALPVPTMVPTPVVLPSLDLGEKTPSLHGVTLGASLPSLSLPTEAPKLPSLSLPVDATTPDLPKLQLPSLSLPGDGTMPSLPSLSLPSSVSKFETKSATKVVPPADTARTVQVKALTSDQIATAQSGSPGDTGVALGKLGRAIEGGAPVYSASPAGPVLPSLNLEPAPTAQPVSAPRAAPKETSPVQTGNAKPVAKEEKKADKKSEKKQESKKAEPPKPEPKKAEAPKVAKSSSDTDLEIAAFKKQGRGGRIAAIALGGVAVVGGGGYFGWKWYASRVPATATAAYEKGRGLYLTDTRAKFSDAEAAYQEAIKLAGEAPYAAPFAGLAELHAAWGEPLYVKLSELLKQHEAKLDAAKKDPENKELAAEVAALGKRANEVNAEAKAHLGVVNGFAAKAVKIDPENVAARRALLDYFRVTGMEKEAQAELGTLKTLKATDPETNAHVAALTGSEADLAASIQANPNFVRAYTWLADLHVKAKKEAEAAKDWSAALKVAPGHELAAEALAAAKPPVPPTPDVKPEEKKPETKTAEAKAPEKKPEEKKPEETKPEVKTAETKPAEKAEPAPAAAVDVDKTLGQADKLFEKGKYAKALELYEKAAAARPTSAEAHFGVGLSNTSLKKYDTAIASFKKTLELSPRFGDAMISLAEAYKAKGQNKDAAKYYRQYLDNFPKGEYAVAAKQNVDALK